MKCYTNKMAKSVRCEIYEADFERLIHLLTVKPKAMDIMAELAIQADAGRFDSDVDLQKQKEEAIALCKRRIAAAIHLYKDGVIDRAEYLRTREANEREIVHWENRTTEAKKLAVELALCVEAIDKLSRLWALPNLKTGEAWHAVYLTILCMTWMLSGLSTSG